MYNCCANVGTMLYDQVFTPNASVCGHFKVLPRSQDVHEGIDVKAYGSFSGLFPSLFSSPILSPPFCPPMLAPRCRLQAEVASLLGNSVRRQKGGNYIHAASPLSTQSISKLLTGNWFKKVHNDILKMELCKCLCVFVLRVCVLSKCERSYNRSTH